jgi:hypothetical protein
MSWRVLALSLALCAPYGALAAPVPPVRLVTAEAAVKPPRGNPRELAAKLTSAPFLDGVAKSRPVVLGRLGGLRYEKDPASWLAARLKADVDTDHGTVTLRLIDCPRRDAVALLSAVVEAYKAEVLSRSRNAEKAREQRDAIVQFVILRQLNANAQAGVNGAVRLNDFAVEVLEGGPSEAEVERSVIQSPRVVQPGLPSKSGR